jgi:hypothetical protein
LASTAPVAGLVHPVDSVYTTYIPSGVPGFPEVLAHCTGFEWDAGNAEKNWRTHRVSQAEGEQAFFNRPVVIAPDLAHSGTESRYAALGRTHSGRRLSVVFTIRDSLVRIISARDMSRGDRRLYAQVDAAS